MEKLFTLTRKDTMDKGYLILSDKTYYPGYIFGHGDLVFGEVVFNTSMTGYQEILTLSLIHI